jgi:hypothetical protein
VTTEPGAARLDEFLALVLQADELAHAGKLAEAVATVAKAELLINYDDVADHRKRMTKMVASTRKAVDEIARQAARKANKARSKAQKDVEQSQLRCAVCDRPGSERRVQLVGSRHLCGQCWSKARQATCTECLKPFQRAKDAPRARKCSSCQPDATPSRSVRTTSGGLPSLGKRS